jgi:outer membrane autotransporter protein
VALACTLAVSMPALAECGGTVQCIAIGLSPADALNAHHGGPAPATPTVAFGNQVIGTSSASQTVFVAAVTGPGGTMAVLGPITLSGANAADFSITGGSCSTTNGPVHGGAQCTITVAFNPASLGAKSATLSVPLNPPPGCVGCITGRSATLTGTGTLAAPGAGAASLTVQAGTSGTIDLAPFVSGTAILGVNIVSAPANGTVSLSGMRATYTPNAGFAGNDSFSYASFSATATSAPAAVSVSVVARADPSQDPNVRALLGAQAQTSRRFARAQIFNFQQRMESLHRGAEPGSTSSIPRFSPVLAASAEPAATAQAPRPDAVPHALNFSHAGRISGNSGLAGTGVWVGGSLNFGTRDAAGNSSGLRFGTEGISAGVDRRLSEHLALGMGVGYARDRTEIGGDGTRSRSSGASIAAYASYQPAPEVFVDGLLGYGTVRHRTDRFVAAASDFARADRSGDQIFGSLAAGYEMRRNGVLLSPYARADYSRTRLKQATESGAGVNALTYFEQRSPSLELGLGLRAESQHATSFGWALPRLRIEYRHDFRDDREARVAYADLFAGPVYSVAPATTRRDALLLGIGSDFLFRDGLTLGVDYQIQRLSGAERSQAVRLWLAKELDGRSRPSGLQDSSRLFANPVNVEGAYAWDDNVTRSRAGDRLSDHVYSLQVSQALVFPAGSHTRLVGSWFASGDKLRTYRGLDRVSAGAQGELQYRASGEFDAPTVGLLARLAFDDYQSQLRGGHRASLGLTVRQLLSDRIALFGALARNSRFAKHEVFDARDTSLRVNLDYTLGRQGTLYLGGEYRRGDAVSTAGASAESSAIAKFLVRDDAYGGMPRFAYRYEAETTLWTLGYNRPLGPRDSLDLSWRHASASPTARGTYSVPAGPYGPAGTVTVGKSRYRANLYSIAYLMRF